MYSKGRFYRGIRSKTKTPKGTELLFLEDPLALVSCFSENQSSDCEEIGEAIGNIFLMNRRSTDLLSICAAEEIFSTGTLVSLNLVLLLLLEFLFIVWWY